MGVVSAFVAGLLFAGGLAVAQMTHAHKVVAFLDLGPNWDPSLAFVMVGAIGVHLALRRLVLRRRQPVLAVQFEQPQRSDIDGRLLAGSLLFGLGWGIAGFCPGPALTAAGGGVSEALLFVPAMLGGMGLFAVVDRLLVRARSPQPKEAASNACG
ncbi:MAG: YeeE/YedE family protein [Myxococcales bacterium]|nr:YeeE/YedE family protein [Myxococcales bacterium]MCB9524836.1 YeeE/YedE family protein [Myxococcales bacterium]